MLKKKTTNTHLLKAKKRLFLLFGLLVIIFPSLSAQNYIVNIQQYGIEDGLSHREVRSIVKDKRGFLWLATPFGVNRFDGYEFKWWTKEQDGIPSNNVTSLAIDAEEDLWVMTATTLHYFGFLQSLAFLDTKTGKIKTVAEKFPDGLPFSLSDLGRNFLKSENGTLFFSTRNGVGLITYHPEVGFQIFPLASFATFLPTCLSNKKTIWGLADNQHLVEISQKGEILQVHPHADSSNWRDIVYLQDEMLYMTKLDGAFAIFHEIDDKGQYQVVFPDSLKIPVSSQKVGLKALKYLPHQNQLWVFSKDFLNIVHPYQNELLNLFDDFPKLHQDKGIGFKGFHSDSSGLNWLGGDYGLYQVLIEQNKFTHYLYEKDWGKDNILLNANQLIDNIPCRGIYANKDKIYVNTERFNVKIIDQRTKNNVQKNHNLSTFKIATKFNRAFASHKGKADNLWIGHDGLYRLNLGDESFVHFPTHLSASKVETIWAIFEDEKNRLWVGGMVGLQWMDTNELQLHDFRDYHQFAALKTSSVMHINEDKDGQIWICSNTGLYVLDPEKGITARYWSGGEGKYFLPFDNFYHFYQDEAGIFWLATAGGGLIKWDKKEAKFQQFTKVDGLPNNVIYAVYEDDHNHLWMSSDYGIIQFDKTNFQSRTYLEEDGITYHEFNRISHFQAADGRIYFGGLNGVTAFHPDDFYDFKTTNNAPLQITQFQQFDGELNQLVDKTAEILENQQIKLHPDDRFFKLSFSLLTYKATDRIQYAYQVEGVDEDWTYQKESSIRMGRLPYGNHVLKIKGQAADGQWSTNVLAIDIQVIKPIYLQNWFLLLLTFVFAILITAIIKWRTWQYKKNQKILEAEVAQQTATIRKQTDKLRTLDATKTRFYTNITHEFRTPLTVILGMTNQVEKDDWQAKLNATEQNRLSNSLNLITRNGKKLLSLINQLLDLSKLDSNNLKLHYQTKEVVSFIQYVGESFASLAEKKGIRLNIYSEIDALVMEVDEHKLQQIIENLLANAIKFTSVNEKIVLHLCQKEDKLQIKIKDTGEGIAAEDLPHIFDRFYQVENQSSQQGEGTGIGLALVKELVDIMEGTIEVKSKIGKGTTFTLLLPIKKSLEKIAVLPSLENTIDKKESAILNLPNKTASLSPTNNENAHLPQLLIVEDNPDVVFYIQSILAPHYQIEIAKNGQEGIEKAIEHIPDIIISDVMMPKKNGFQLVETLKQDERTSHIPIILLTAKATHADKLAGLKYGADAYLMKPFNQEELLVRLEKLLEVRKALQQKYAVISANNLENLTQIELSQPKTPEDIFIEKLHAVLEKIYQNSELSTQELAQEMHLSYYQFNRKLKALTDKTPALYLRSFRLQKAKILLVAENDLNVSEVGYEVGFTSPNYFSRAFMEEFGKSPNEVRR